MIDPNKNMKNDHKLYSLTELNMSIRGILKYTLLFESYLNYVEALRWCHCRYYHVKLSSSSCVHGASLELSLGWLQNTLVWWVLITRMLLSIDITLVARNDNSSSLFSSMRRNSCQFPRTALEGSTRLRTPFPLFSRLMGSEMDVVWLTSRSLT